MRPHWTGSDALWQVERVALRLEGSDPQWHDVEAVRQGPQGPLLKIRGVDTREAAEGLRGAAVLVERAALNALAPGEYYLADLVGCQVQCAGKSLGQVVAVCTHPTVDSILIRTPDGLELEQPLVGPWVDEVLIEQRTITLTSEDGILS